MTPGEYLNLYLLRKEIPRWEIIKATGVSKARISQLMTAPERGLSVRLAFALERACGVDAETLLSLEIIRLRKLES